MPARCRAQLRREYLPENALQDIHDCKQQRLPKQEEKLLSTCVSILKQKIRQMQKHSLHVRRRSRIFRPIFLRNVQCPKVEGLERDEDVGWNF